MKKLSDLWFKYLASFPDQETKFGTLIESSGLVGAIKILEKAIERGKKIEFTDGDGTDLCVPFIVGENI